MNFCKDFYTFSLKSNIYAYFADLKFSLKTQNPKYLNSSDGWKCHLFNYTHRRVQSSTFKQILIC